MPKMLATKRQRYDGKNVSIGDIFTVKDKDVRLMTALKWVTPYNVPTVETSTPLVVQQPTPEPEPINTLKFVESEVAEDTNVVEDTQTTEYSRMLRDRAMALGIRVDGRWSDARIQREIDEYNKNTYQRMDLRAEEP